jgi:hypothetical protein
LNHQPPDYSSYHAAQAAKWLDVTDRSVLVVGSNRGYECSYFIEIRARKVVRIDVIDDVVVDIIRPSVSYLCVSAEQMPIDGRRARRPGMRRDMSPPSGSKIAVACG